MYIENWEDTAFGTDFGLLFMEFVERLVADNKVSFAQVVSNCGLKKYFDNPALLTQRTDNNVELHNQPCEMYVHYEDAVIALSAIAVEGVLNGEVDLSAAYGKKTFAFEIVKSELETLKTALAAIYENPEGFVLFEMCMPAEKEETLADIKQIIEGLTNSIDKKL